jgi:hypothetical protein
LDDVYYYAELFSGLVRDLEDGNRETFECEDILKRSGFYKSENVSNLVNAVNQFIDDSKVVR